ncbi:Rap1a/Tai family immunity protein [Pararhizobium qamdonense]|uniref:Rap1a/Tai family immunity protein n=1 Tax=Pararhizobium qamdonense TaxID=3031126 RepID=UPI0023E2EE89|nr:Rap1a/Tai family immunity protein [Pararhizobium qamdonense]
MKITMLSMALAGLIATDAVAIQGNGYSYFIKAPALKEACQSMDAYGREGATITNDGIYAAGRCYGAILGILDSMTLQPMLSKGQVKNIQFCLPPEMDAGDVAMKLATKIVNMSAAPGVPEDVAAVAPAYLMVLEAARQEFPCSM